MLKKSLAPGERKRHTIDGLELQHSDELFQEIEVRRVEAQTQFYRSFVVRVDVCDEGLGRGLSELSLLLFCLPLVLVLGLFIDQDVSSLVSSLVSLVRVNDRGRETKFDIPSCDLDNEYLWKWFRKFPAPNSMND